MPELERKVVDFVRKHFMVVLLILVVAVAIMVRINLFEFQSSDYNIYLHPWFDALKEKGLRGVFSTGGIGDYNCPYMLLLWVMTKLPFDPLISIKVVSVIFDFGLAIMSALVVKEVLGEKEKDGAKINMFSSLAFTAVLLLPTVIFNGAYWGQCDSIYSCFVVASIYMLVKKKYIPSFILLGFAFSFKLQFIFVLPIYLLVYLKNKEFSILNFLWIPAVLIALSLPAFLAGLPFLDVFKIYFEQVGEYKNLTLSMMNIYAIFDGKYEYVSVIGYALCTVIFGGIYYYFLKDNKKLKNDMIITLMLLSVMVCVCFLPSMHERYGYLADILAVVCFASRCLPVAVPILMETLSLIGYFSFLFGFPFDNYKLLGLVMVGMIAYTGNKAIALHDGEKKLISRS